MSTQVAIFHPTKILRPLRNHHLTKETKRQILTLSLINAEV